MSFASQKQIYQLLVHQVGIVEVYIHNNITYLFVNYVMLFMHRQQNILYVWIYFFPLSQTFRDQEARIRYEK